MFKSQYLDDNLWFNYINRLLKQEKSAYDKFIGKPIMSYYKNDFIKASYFNVVSENLNIIQHRKIDKLIFKNPYFQKYIEHAYKWKLKRFKKIRNKYVCIRKDLNIIYKLEEKFFKYGIILSYDGLKPNQSGHFIFDFEDGMIILKYVPLHYFEHMPNKKEVISVQELFNLLDDIKE